MQRLFWDAASRRRKPCTTSLGYPLSIIPGEAISLALQRTGAHELEVAEVVYRLLEKGDVAIDVGASLGFITSIMAQKVGDGGKVFAFEPNPAIVPLLQENCKGLQVAIVAVGVSDNNGQLFVHGTEEMEKNAGRVYLSNEPSEVVVEVITLDNYFAHQQQPIQLMKIDTEGHESKVLGGAVRMLKSHQIQHIVYEDFDENQSSLQQQLQATGYTVFRLIKRFWGVELVRTDYAGGGKKAAPWETTNFLATLAPGNALQTMKKQGYQVLRKRKLGEMLLYLFHFVYNAWSQLSDMP